MEDKEKESSNRQRIRSVLATGLKDHPREADIDKFYEVADSLVESFEQSTKLSIEDEGVDVAGVKLEISPTGPEQDPEGNVSVAYSRRHSGLFPFPHDHCTVEFCWDTTQNGRTVTVCVEIEYPCNIDWPILGDF